MKALETHQLLGLIVIIIIIILVIIIIVNPTLLFGGWGVQLASFNDFCIIWRLKYYQPGLNGEIQIEDEEGEIKKYNVTIHCSKALGRDPTILTDTDIEKCRDLCKR